MYKTFDTKISNVVQRMGKRAPWLWEFFAAWAFYAFIIAGVYFAWLMPFGAWLTTLALPVVGVWFATMLVQFVVRRPRPSHTQNGFKLWVHTYSFPSAHASTSFGCAVLLSAAALTTTPHIAAVLIPAVFVLASLIALSRIAVGVHYPSDVAAGIIFGTILAGLFAFFVVLA
ncbi:MAG: phosphatase PAP2 family protein [Patescibacteria group bacterium]